ncbi:MAG TPA: hypothetical protein VN428_08560 [Bryobacteraceae bacterium]|nr:hypothetical protein [Bryobacteraceae bacterium]
MAKVKLAKGKSKKSKANWSKSVPCLIVILAIFGLLMLLFYSILSSK